MSTPPIDAEADGEARALTDDLERDVIAHLRTPLIVATVLLSLFFANEWHRGALAWPQVVQTLNWIALCVVVRLRVAHSTRKAMVVLGLAVNPVCALVHYGALIGTGVFSTTSLLGATFFYGRRGAVAMWSFLTLSLVVCAALSLQGTLTPDRVPLTAREWFRMGLAASVALAMVGYFFWLITSAARRAFGHLVSARREKESAQLSAQRLESLGRLAGGVAHELNNALQVVQSGVDLLRTQTSSAAGPADAERISDEIARAVDAAAATANRLLAFGRSRPEDAGRTSLAPVLLAFVSSTRRWLPGPIALELHAAADLGDVGIAPLALEEVLGNLVANAVDALPQGGRIDVHARRVENDVVISVADDGPGIPASVAARVFEPFFTTRSNHQGLGLAAVWGIVTRVGGAITCVPADGHARGARFDMRLPALPTTANEASVASASAPHVGARKRRLLLLEDEPDVLRIFIRILKRAGYEVTAFERVAPALAALAVSEFDVLMTDVIVPDGGVPSLIDSFRKRAAPGAPILVCSGHVEEDLVAHGIARGDYRFLRKPFAGPELIAALDELFAKTGA
ncbi:MAG TPA: ATP-binding protein [Myxococcota bacterium]|jgi:signal transduction histidine kinase